MTPRLHQASPKTDAVILLQLRLGISRRKAQRMVRDAEVVRNDERLAAHHASE